MFNRRFEFDGKTPDNANYIFASGAAALGVQRCPPCAHPATACLPWPARPLAGPPSHPAAKPNTEYAVTTGGGWGNLAGAVSEAAFMTGMERNSDIVLMGAYVSSSAWGLPRRCTALPACPACRAGTPRPSCPPPCPPQAPLFVHTNNRPWPTNLIVINNHE